ncbi:hypothetical protein [Marinobacter sp. X15-166B]|uniref:hypothetical protein n=1 Tax=Marinobacter sp. X15-166B TaxID=1897620 RepID=UPI00085CC1D1|nr:hypothetical protein [Marinobacter sp. X15-166B]OEY67350.1 hypothetical protein BG841_13485 [Marinobacter sp. X15-166B]
MRSYLIAMTTALAVIAGLSASAVEAACEVSFKGVRQDNQRPYSMLGPGVSVIALTVNVETSDCPNLSFTFDSTNNNALVGPGGTLPYQLKGSSGRNIEVNGISAVPGQLLITDRQNQALGLRAFVAPGRFSSPGRYTDRVNLKAWDGNSAIAEIELPLAIHVRPEADISLTGQASHGYSAKGGGGMNFGALLPGKERSAFLFVRSNVSYALNISSENQGHLVHRQEIGGQARIPYAAWLDNERLTLSAPARVRANGMTAIQRSRPHRLSARIEPHTNKLAGDYQDVIIVEVVFLE